MNEDLHARLEAVAGKIDAAQSALEARSGWHDGHRLTAGEMKARYEYLQREVSGEIKDREAHGHRVSDLEQSVRQWIDGLGL